MTPAAGERRGSAAGDEAPAAAGERRGSAGGGPPGTDCQAAVRPSTALLTDRYELTMLDAAVASGVADRPATFEVFTRRLPEGRQFGVFAGLGRLLDAIDDFHFGPAELDWLAGQGVASDRTLTWLSQHRFAGDIDAYQEGELYTAGSPVLTVRGCFGEAVLLETLTLSILNFDSAVAAAAAVIVAAAAGRPVIEMGSRRTDPNAALGAARAAYLAGFASTSNLEAGRRWGIPTAGTAAHAFTLAHSTERQAFAAQVSAMGAGTTLLVDTYDPEEGIRNAVAVAGTDLGAVRIDSGDLVSEAWRARDLLDRLGATATRIVVTGDLDNHVLVALADAPVDAYGVGTNVVTGLGSPTAGLVYKLVEVADDAVGELRAVAKRSPGKATIGGRKWAWRGRSSHAPEVFSGPAPRYDRAVLADVIATRELPPGVAGRPLVHRVVDGGRRVGVDDPAEWLAAARAHHRRALADLPPGEPLISYYHDG
jgi:nicotinate phosphoribosyltransferase